MSESLKAEVVILLKLILDKLTLAVKLGDGVKVHDTITRQFQKIKCAHGVVALRFRRIKPLLYLFSEFVVHNALAFGCHKITSSIIADKRRKMCIFPLKRIL